MLKKIYHYILRFILCVYETIRYYLTPINNRFVLTGYTLTYNETVFHVNFGDDINYYLIKELTGKKIFKYDYLFFPNSRHNILCIGSIIERWSNSMSIIWGSGLMYANIPLLVKPQKIMAVRGPLTRRQLQKQGIDCPNSYGDPALLMPLIYTPQVTKKYKYGIIPHCIDRDNINVIELAKVLSNCCIIDFSSYGKWQDVIDNICECECILSSSLHGLILSDAYNIVNVWIEFSNKIKGERFKYLDYFASVARNDVAPIVVNAAINIADIQIAQRRYKQPQINIEILLNNAPFDLLSKYRKYINAG